MADIPNQISLVVPEEKMQQFQNLMEQLEGCLDFLVSLSPAQRRSLPKLGQNGVGFVNQGLDLVKQKNDFMPAKFSVEEFSKDVILTNQMLSMRNRLNLLMSKVKDTYLLASSEAYKAALVVYQNGKANGGSELKPVLDEMGALFARAKTEVEASADKE